MFFSIRPVPVYYQGAGSEYLDNAVGQGFESYGQQVPGIDGYIDRVHIGEAQFEAFGMSRLFFVNSYSNTYID